MEYCPNCITKAHALCFDVLNVYVVICPFMLLYYVLKLLFMQFLSFESCIAFVYCP